MPYFIFKGKGTYDSDKRQQAHKAYEDSKRSGVKLPIEADPNHRELKKVGKEVLSMKRHGESTERINRELNPEAMKYTKL